MIFRKGEVRQIGVEVFNQLGQDFIIENADFEILDSKNLSVDKGYATIEGHKIITLFSATEVGDYVCVLTYRIGAEVIKAKINLEVV